MLRHRVDKLLARHLGIVQREFGINRLALAHQVARLLAQQLQRMLDFRRGGRVLLVIDNRGLGAALLQQLQRSARF